MEKVCFAVVAAAVAVAGRRSHHGKETVRTYARSFFGVEVEGVAGVAAADGGDEHSGILADSTLVLAALA